MKAKTVGRAKRSLSLSARAQRVGGESAPNETSREFKEAVGTGPVIRRLLGGKSPTLEMVAHRAKEKGAKMEVQAARGEVYKRYRLIIDALSQRVGTSPHDLLAWAARVAQRGQEDLTPGDWQNLRLEFAAFLWPRLGTDEPMDTVDVDQALPTKEETQKALIRMREIIAAAVKRQPISLGRFRSDRTSLFWHPETSTWQPEYSFRSAPGWADETVEKIGHLMEDAGAFLKECPAPAVRAKAGETCGVWFVAKRANQDYCSGTCQSRASTRAKRSGAPTPATLKRRQAKKEG